MRKCIRIKGFNYSNEGYYFITICTKNRLKLLSTVGVAVLSDPPNLIMTTKGKIAKKHIENCNKKIKNIIIDEYIIMPNHIHMIIRLSKGSLKTATPTISKIINSYKGMVTKEIGYSIWQRNYYEHIIRNENEYLKIKEYIINNPIDWEKDIYF